MHPRSSSGYCSRNAQISRPCNARSTRPVRIEYGLTLLLIGCGGVGHDARAPLVAPVSAADIRSMGGDGTVAQTTRASVPTTIVSANETTNVEELFVLGQTHLRQGRPLLAAETFDRIVRHDPDGPFSERALFQGALAFDAAGDLEAAALRFEQVTRRFPAGAWGAEATLRALRVRLHLEQWARAAELSIALTEGEPRGPALTLIVSHAARALAALASGQQSDADRHVAKGLSIAERLGLDRAGTIPRDLAILYFASGEAYRQRAEAVALAGDVSGFVERLEQRCELMLAAQGAYSNVMRAYDAHWSTMAGYRVGELYERLHRELMALPMPRTGNEREQRLFEGAMRLRYSVLLGKAESMLDHTLAMAARTGESSEWVARTESARLEISRARREEQEALSRLPFTRDELQRAMDELGARPRTPQ